MGQAESVVREQCEQARQSWTKEGVGVPATHGVHIKSKNAVAHAASQHEFSTSFVLSALRHFYKSSVPPQQLDKQLRALRKRGDLEALHAPPSLHLPVGVQAALEQLAVLPPGLAVPTAVRAGALVSFGDSLSDNGNSWRLTGCTHPAPPALEGRFSDARVWVEFLAVMCDCPLTDLAHAGATTDSTAVQGFTGPTTDFPVPSLREQVGMVRAVPADAIATVWGGSNDYYFDALSLPPVVAGRTVDLVRELAQKGFCRFLVVGMYPWGNSPTAFNSFAKRHTYNALASLHNLCLKDALVDLINELNAGRDDARYHVWFLDAYALFKRVLRSPQQFGFAYNYVAFHTPASGQRGLALPTPPPPRKQETAGKRVQCVSTAPIQQADAPPPCAPVAFSPASLHVFFDDFHPSARMHRVIAEAAYACLMAAPLA